MTAIWPLVFKTLNENYVMCYSNQTFGHKNLIEHFSYLHCTITVLSINVEIQWKYTKRWKQSSDIKQLVKNPFIIIKMCSEFPTDIIWMNIMCAAPLANHLRAVADAFRPLRTYQRYWTIERQTSQQLSPSNH